MERIKTREELMKWLKLAEGVIDKYYLEEWELKPYPGVTMTAKEIIAECRDFDHCSRGSKQYILSLANGFKERLEDRIRQMVHICDWDTDEELMLCDTEKDAWNWIKQNCEETERGWCFNGRRIEMY